jgi:hypothetical protein
MKGEVSAASQQKSVGQTLRSRVASCIKVSARSFRCGSALRPGVMSEEEVEDKQEISIQSAPKISGRPKLLPWTPNSSQGTCSGGDARNQASATKLQTERPRLLKLNKKSEDGSRFEVSPHQAEMVPSEGAGIQPRASHIKLRSSSLTIRINRKTSIDDFQPSGESFQLALGVGRNSSCAEASASTNEEITSPLTPLQQLLNTPINKPVSIREADLRQITKPASIDQIRRSILKNAGNKGFSAHCKQANNRLCNKVQVFHSTLESPKKVTFSRNKVVKIYSTNEPIEQVLL